MKILLVDRNADIRELTSMMLSSQFVTEIVEAQDGIEAIQKIETQMPFDLVISGYQLNGKSGIDIFKSLRKVSSKVPFILVSSEAHNHLNEFNNDPYFEALQKPFEEELLIGKVQLLASKSEIKEWASGYVPVSIDVLEKMNTVSVPLFIQLSDSHFVKVSHGRSLFSFADALKMKSKGLKNLFVELANFSLFISQFRKNVFSQVAWDKADPHACMQMLSRDWELVMKASREFGCTPEVIELAQENIARALSVMSQTLSLKNIFNGFASAHQNRLSAHCYMLATLMTALVKELGWAAPTTLQKLTFAALLHDMDLDEELFTSKQTLLNSTDFKEFADDPGMKRLLQHPQRGAELVRAWASCPSDVDEIILQHHEKIDGTGFPLATDAKAIAPLSALFILSEDIIYHCVDNFGVIPLEYLRSKKDYYQQGEFAKIYSAADKVMSHHAN